MTLHAEELYFNFWFTQNKLGLSLFFLICILFGLFFIWACLDFFRAFFFNYSDKKMVAVVFIIVIAFNVFLVRSLWAKWELLEIENGNLTIENSIFLKSDLPVPLEMPLPLIQDVDPSEINN